MAVVKGYCDSKFKEIEDILRDSIESSYEIGASVAVSYNKEMIVDLHGGFKDESKNIAWDKDTIVNTYSVTKGITAICIAMLIDRGQLDVNKKVSDYWPEYGCNGKENTKVIDFLCHRACNFGFHNGIPSDSWQNWNLYADILAKQEPFAEPGSMQGYHAITYGWLVGEIIRRIDGRDVGTYFKEEIAEPLNINFKIGLSEEDFVNCADMQVLEDFSDSSPPFKKIKYVPDIMLPEKLKNLKKSMETGHFKIAFQKRAGDNKEYVNSSDWRKAQIPSANGHGTSRGLAKLYGILSSDCKENGNEIINPETLRYCIQPCSSGPDTVLFGSDITFGLGFELASEMLLKGSFSPRFMGSMYGHAGIGGAVAFGDIDKKIGFSFLCNKMHDTKNLYRTANQLIDALYSKI